MSDDSIPDWGQSLEQRVADLERRFGQPVSSPDGIASPSNVSRLAPAEKLETDAGTNVRENVEAGKRQQELEALEREVQAVQTRLAQARKEAEIAEALVEGNHRNAEETRAALEARAAAVQAEIDLLGSTRRVIELIWPRFLLTEPFGKWKTDLETALLAETPSSSAALLFANLHGYTACLLESDLKYLRDVLRDISRFLYAWIKEAGEGEQAAYHTAVTWAVAFNDECAGRCEIEVPEPGNPANNVSMTFPPRGSSPEVVSVRTWCVRDAQRRVIHRAEVFT